MTTQGKSKTGKLTLVISSMFDFKDSNRPQILHEDWNEGTHLQKFRKSLKKGDKL